MGGARRAAQGSPAGRQTASRFASFLQDVASGGIASAARAIGIAAFLNQSTDIFLPHLADALAPAGALTEDAIARAAMDDTLLELFEQLDLANGGVQKLERLTPTMMAEALVRYVINYVYRRVLNALTAHVHAKSPAVSRMRDIEATARHYIEDAVRLDVDTSVFFGIQGEAFAQQWDGSQGRRLMDGLFEESYRVVQAGLHHGDREAG